MTVDWARSQFAAGTRQPQTLSSTPERVDKPGALTDERKKTHGDWATTARISYGLKGILRDELDKRGPLADLPAAQVEALEMILAKIARIVSGDPNHPDHWLDIAGYAQLGHQACTGGK